MLKLFSEFKIGPTALRNRIVMAPMTRSRASEEGVLGQMTVTYYKQRSSAGLIITEATAVSRQGSGYPKIPGIWSEAQTEAWARVAKGVREEGGIIFMQLFHTGRIGHSTLFGENPVSASAEKPKGQVMAADFSMQPYETPRALDEGEVKDVVNQFKVAAHHAQQAGVNGIELHSANGYLLDQFLRNGVNKRSDRYGGSIENRARLLFEVLQECISIFGPNRVGVRFSPFSPFNDMSDTDPVGLYSYIAQKLNDLPIAYLHLVDPIDPGARPDTRITPTLRNTYKGAMIVNGGLTRESGEDILARNEADLVAYGIPFIANPDLVERFRRNIHLATADRSTFYTGGEKGYVDYPIAS